MLSCHELAHKTASDYIDDQLDWRKRLPVTMHLLLCVNCRRFVRQLKQVKALILRRPVLLTDRQDIAASGEGDQNSDYLGNLARRLSAEYKRYNNQD